MAFLALAEIEIQPRSDGLLADKLYAADLEAREMKLPISRWIVRYPVTFYKFVDNVENLIRQDQEIVPWWDDYKSARDPLLDWVLKYKT